MRIGFFDSGIGGITVLHEALKIMPDEDYLYYADTLHVPYGTKPRDEVKNYIFDAVDFIAAQNVKAVVIACNTATSVAVAELRERHRIPVIGMEPAVKPAVGSASGGRILVTATALTLKEEKLHNLISGLGGGSICDLLPLPELVRFAENGEFGRETVLPYLLGQLSAYDLSRYEALVLGCTHFLFFKDLFGDLLPPYVRLFDGNEGTVRNLRRILSASGSLHGGSGDILYYHSGTGAGDEKDLLKYRQLFERLKSLDGRKGTDDREH